jgi:hypothetical protein
MLNKSTIFSIFFLFTFLCCSQLIFAQQSDIGPSTVLGIGSHYGITPEEKVFIQNQTQTGSSVPAEILEALSEARKSGDLEQVEKLNELILKEYSEGVRVVGTAEDQNQAELPVPDYTLSAPAFDFDWLNNDVRVDTGTTLNFQGRNLDMKYGDDGNMYVAHSLNQAGYRGIRVLRSTNGGLNWTYIGGIFYPAVNRYIQTLSMVVDKRATTNDSLRVIVYYTHSASSNNNGASLAFFSYNPATNNYLLKSIDTPSSARTFNFVSAVSDGKYYDAATYIGCIVGDYSNDADSTYNINLYRSSNWGNTHTSISMPFAASGWVDIRPTAAMLPGSNSSADSIMFTTQRDFGTFNGLRAYTTSWATLSASYRTIFLTSGGEYLRPVIAIKQSPRGVNKSIMITCTKDGNAKYHRSLNSGVTWDLDFTLDQRSPAPPTTRWTYVSTDTLGTTGDFITVFSNNNSDSVNIRRGQSGSLGTTTYKVNSEDLTTTNPPICAIYRTGTTLSSTVSYYAWGPKDVYYDAEHLVTSIDDSGEPITKFELFQNYPNPFNPSTTIKYSVPTSSLVKIKVFNTLGQEIAELVNKEHQTGNFEVTFDATNFSSGIYFYRLESDNFVQTQKMILIK